MHGSIPVFSFVLKKDCDEGMPVAEKLRALLEARGWKWFKDFTYNFNSFDRGILFEFYDKSMVPLVKRFMVENSL